MTFFGHQTPQKNSQIDNLSRKNSKIFKIFERVFGRRKKNLKKGSFLAIKPPPPKKNSQIDNLSRKNSKIFRNDFLAPFIKHIFFPEFFEDYSLKYKLISENGRIGHASN